MINSVMQLLKEVALEAFKDLEALTVLLSLTYSKIFSAILVEALQEGQVTEEMI